MRAELDEKAQREIAAALQEVLAHGYGRVVIEVVKGEVKAVVKEMSWRRTGPYEEKET